MNTIAKQGLALALVSAEVVWVERMLNGYTTPKLSVPEPEVLKMFPVPQRAFSLCTGLYATRDIIVFIERWIDRWQKDTWLHDSLASVHEVDRAKLSEWTNKLRYIDGIDEMWRTTLKRLHKCAATQNPANVDMSQWSEACKNTGDTACQNNFFACWHHFRPS